MRDVTARLRESLAGLRSHRHGEPDDEYGKPWMLTLDPPLASDGPRVPPIPPRPPAPPRPPRPPLYAPLEPPPAEPPAVAGDAGLVPALQRVADAFEKIAAGLEADRRERGVRLDAVEALVRELVSGLSQPTAVPPIVVGGTIDLSEPPEVSIDGPALPGRAGVDGRVDTA